MGYQQEFKEVAGISGLEAEDILLGKIRRAADITSGAPTRVFRRSVTMGLLLTPRFGERVGVEQYIEVASIIHPDRVTGRVWRGNIPISYVVGTNFRDVIAQLGTDLAEWLES